MKPKAIYILNHSAFQKIYDDAGRARINEMCDVIAEPQDVDSIAANPDILNDVEVIFSGWGCPEMNAELLSHAPKLKALFYGAGTVKGVVTPEFWAKGIVLTSSWAANAVPVAEFALSEIIFSLKNGWMYVLGMKRDRKYMERIDCAGGYKSTVAIISLGMIGRKLAVRLKEFDINVIAYDPFAKQEDAVELGVELVSLEDAFKRADVVSIHTPWLKETENLIGGALIRSMKERATLINTSRGAIINEPEMCAVLAERPDITAVLDVTHPEPPVDDSPLWTLPNVILTPHIAGSLCGECSRMGQYAIDECERFLKGEPLKFRLTEEMARRMA